MTNLTVLIVDDEPDIRELITLTLNNMSLKTIGVPNLTEAKKTLTEQAIDICLTDMRLPDGDGLDLVDYIQANYAHIPVAVITAYGNVELAVSALKRGAFDFVSKPVNINLLRSLINLARQQIISEKEKPKESVTLLGNSLQLAKVRNIIEKVAKSQAPVLILGESGTGKEMAARLIHEKSARREKNFIAVNCGAIPDELMESEFFGYEKGSFTGANADKAGLFTVADGGTLFLDEIAELPLHMQVKLLRAIQEKAIRPIGAKQEVYVDCRIISATNQNLGEMLTTQQFRQDLFYRINVIEIRMPALREHMEDLKLLADFYLQKIAVDLGVSKRCLSDEAFAKLASYSFPGNVRELENILARASALCEKEMITSEQIELSVIEKPLGNLSSEPNSENLAQMARELIIQTLDKYHWNKKKTADALGITLRALRYRLKKLNIDKE